MVRASLVFSVLAISSTVSPALALPTDYKAKADALLAASYAADGPGAQVVISEKGRIVYRSARGLADVAAKRPIDQATVFRIGSITKQFAAAVVLQLAEEGKLTLDDPLSKHLPDYPGGAAITVRQLLNHTSGIQSYTGIPGWMIEANTNRAYSTAQLVAQFKDLPASSKPGQAFSYNNSGYVLVGALIEAVTGRAWYDEVDRRITKPLGLTSLRYGRDEARVAAMAKGYTDDGGKIAPAMKIDMSVPAAAGALIANARDLARWNEALHHGKVVKAPYYAQMIAPTRLPGGKVEQYGFGLSSDTLRGFPVVGHGGGIFGFSSDSVYIPSADLHVTVLTNSDSNKVQTGVVMNRLAALAIDKPFADFTERPLDAAAVAPALGRYTFDGFERVLTLAGGKLFAQRVGGPQRQVFAAGGNRYFYTPSDLNWFSLDTDAAGKRVMRFHPNGAETAEVGSYAGPVPAAAAIAVVPAATLASYVGTYSTLLGKAQVTLAGDVLMMRMFGSTFPLKSVAPADFTVEGVGVKVRFISVADKVTGIEVVQGGRTLPGTRD